MFRINLFDIDNSNINSDDKHIDTSQQIYDEIYFDTPIIKITKDDINNINEPIREHDLLLLNVMFNVAKNYYQADGK